jgi:hypothetical protein
MKLIHDIKSFLSGKYKFNIVNINGEFLSGKTDIIRELVNTKDFIENYQFFTYISDWNKFNYSFDITEEIIKNSNLSDELSNKGELKYFTNSFFDNLSALNIANKDTFNHIIDYLQLSNDTIPDSNFEKFVDSNIKNELKRMLLQKSFQISIESLLADLFNYFYPLKDGISNVSEYLISNNPVNILLVYDDMQIINPKIEYWIDKFNEYLTSKKLTDFNIFEYDGEESEIKVGEFFNIDTLIISRDKEYNYEHSDFTKFTFFKDYDKSTYEGYEKFPYNDIDYLIEYKQSSNEIKEIDVVVQAVSEIIKYCPENYQKQLIFSSLFEKFDLLNFNLLNESPIKLKSFESLMKSMDFIEKEGQSYQFKDKYKRYFTEIAKELFKEFDIVSLKNTISSLRNTIGIIDVPEFDILRRLTYFEKFEKQFIIENYFTDNDLVSETLEKYIFLFDRKSNIYSLKNEFKDLFENYNFIKDKTEYDTIIDSVNKIKEEYRNEIGKRNEILNNEVVSVGEELDILNNELSEMNHILESRTKEMISIQNDIKTVDEKLEPFSNNNTKRKKTINLVALVISVAVIFNSDRISQLFFDTKDNFDYVVILVVIALLVLYGNGLIRYFRTKLQSEELYLLRQEKKLNSEELYKVNEKIEILSADIRAKEAKIKDLRLHIERANSQILENKKKIIYD